MTVPQYGSIQFNISTELGKVNVREANQIIIMSHLKSLTLTAKAKSKEEQSDAIVVSFGEEWYVPLLDMRFRAVIRKRIPKGICPHWLYFHINTPISAICARARVRKLAILPIHEAIALAKKLSMTPAAISDYVGTGCIGCYLLGRIELTPKPLSAKEISNHMIYHPPQSFFRLSKEAKLIIDELTGFSSK